MRSERATILTPTDIQNIQSYVQRKYAGLPSDRRAEIVNDAMRRIVLRQLPDFPAEMKESLTGTLLREIVRDEAMPVGAEHIFGVSLTLDMDDQSVLEPLHSWFEKRAGLLIDRQQFKHLIKDAAALNQEVPIAQTSALDAFVGKAASFSSGRAPDGHDAGLTVSVPVPEFSRTLPFIKKRPGLYSLLCLLLAGGMLCYGWKMLSPLLTERLQPPIAIKPAEPIQKPAKNELPEELRYAEVNQKQLKDYLNKKDSMLAEPEYMKTIIAAAKEHEIHPLFLFAITGQEQAFVPRSHKNAKKIVNNPFNVYYSYLEYNTNLYDAAVIASRTINRLSKNRPAGIDAITWINREYAEDKNWAKGVTSIFNAMKRQIETYANE